MRTQNISCVSARYLKKKKQEAAGKTAGKGQPPFQNPCRTRRTAHQKKTGLHEGRLGDEVAGSGDGRLAFIVDEDGADGAIQVAAESGLVHVVRLAAEQFRVGVFLKVGDGGGIGRGTGAGCLGLDEVMLKLKFPSKLQAQLGASTLRVAAPAT